MLQHQISPKTYDISYIASVGGASYAKAESNNISGSATRIKVPAKTAICEDGEVAIYCYKIISGSARTVKFTPDGRRQVHAFLEAGDLIGFETEDEYRFTTEAISDCVLLRYPRDAVTEEISHNAAAARQILNSMSRSLNLMQDRLLIRCKTSAIAQVAWFLLQQANRIGARSGGRVTLAMNRTDIADYLGMATETVSRIFKQLKDKGVIKLENLRTIRVVDYNTLEDLSCQA